MSFQFKVKGALSSFNEGRLLVKLKDMQPAAVSAAILATREILPNTNQPRQPGQGRRFRYYTVDVQFVMNSPQQSRERVQLIQNTPVEDFERIIGIKIFDKSLPTLSASPIADVLQPMEPIEEMGHYYLAPIILNDRWVNRDAILRHMNGPLSAPWCVGTISSSKMGKCLEARLWCCLQACRELADTDGAGSIILEPESHPHVLRQALAYTLTAAQMLFLRSTVLKTSGSYPD